VAAADNALQTAGRRLSPHRHMRFDTVDKQFIACSDVFGSLRW